MVESSAAWQEDHGVIAEAWLTTMRGIATRRLPYILAASEAVYHLLEAQQFHRLDQLSTTLLGRDTLEILAAWYKRLFEIDDRENQRPVLELLVALDPKEPRYHRFLGETIEKLERKGAEKALEHYLTAFDLSKFPQNLANLGRCYLARNEPEKFVTLVDGLEEATRAKAVNAHVQDIYSNCLERMGEKEKASRNRQQLIEQGTRQPSLYNDEAVWLQKAGHPKDALAVLDKAEERGVMNDHLRAVQAGILQADGQSAAASILRQGRIAAGASDAIFYNDEARYQWEQRNDPAEAFRILEQAETIGCTDDHSLSIKARLLEALDRGAEASVLRRGRIDAGTRNRVFYNDEALYQWEERDDPAEALRVLEQAERASCADDHTFSVKARLLDALDRGEEASQLRRGRIAAGTRNPSLYNDEALWLRERGDYDEALALLGQAERKGCADEYIRTLRRSIEQRITK